MPTRGAKKVSGTGVVGGCFWGLIAFLLAFVVLSLWEGGWQGSGLLGAVEPRDVSKDMPAAANGGRKGKKVEYSNMPEAGQV